LNDYEMPFFNRCRSSNWVPTLATDFYNKLEQRIY
jgi:hypothetical protein